MASVALSVERERRTENVFHKLQPIVRHAKMRTFILFFRFTKKDDCTSFIPLLVHRNGLSRELLMLFSIYFSTVLCICTSRQIMQYPAIPPLRCDHGCDRWYPGENISLKISENRSENLNFSENVWKFLWIYHKFRTIQKKSDYFLN